MWVRVTVGMNVRMFVRMLMGMPMRVLIIVRMRTARIWRVSVEHRAARVARLRHLFFEPLHHAIQADFPAQVRDRKSTRLNSSHLKLSRMPSSA